MLQNPETKNTEGSARLEAPAVTNQDGGGAMSNLLKLNKLNFTVPKSFSVVTKRSQVRTKAQNSNYTENDTMSILCNSGDLFWYGKNSYLIFEVEMISADLGIETAAFGKRGSAINLFDTVTLTSASGTEIDRREQVYIDAYLNDCFKCQESYWKTMKEVEGASLVDDGQEVTRIAGTAVKRYIVPLRCLSHLFDSENLLPANLMSGMRIDITLNRKQIAFLWSGTYTGTPVTAYAIKNLEIVADAYQLSDAVTKKLNQISATSGLEVLYNGVLQNSRVTGSTEILLNTTQSCSRAVRVVAFNRLKTSAEAYNQDSIRGEGASKYTSFQINVGSLYYPLQTITNTEAMYAYALMAFDKYIMSCNDPSFVSYSDFLANEGIIATDLRRDVFGSISGIAIASSRMLEVVARTSDAVNRVWSLFVVYNKVARIFLDRVVVRV